MVFYSATCVSVKISKSTKDKNYSIQFSEWRREPGIYRIICKVLINRTRLLQCLRYSCIEILNLGDCVIDSLESLLKYESSAALELQPTDNPSRPQFGWIWDEAETLANRSSDEAAQNKRHSVVVSWIINWCNELGKNNRLYATERIDLSLQTFTAE